MLLHIELVLGVCFFSTVVYTLVLTTADVCIGNYWEGNIVTVDICLNICTLSGLTAEHICCISVVVGCGNLEGVFLSGGTVCSGLCGSCNICLYKLFILGKSYYIVVCKATCTVHIVTKHICGNY